MKDKVSYKVSRRSFLAGLASLPLLTLPLTAAQAASINPFTFVYLCDTHLASGVPDNGCKMIQESQLFLQEVIKGINALKPDFVIFGGDQVETVGQNDGNWQFFIDVVQQLSSPWYFVLGEQDVSGKLPQDKMKEFGPDFKGRGISGSEPYWSADPLPNVHLIGLDTSVANSTAGDISEQELEWLKKDLAANKGKFTIVISHHPLLPPAPYDGGPPFDEYIVPNGADAREIIGGSSDVRLVLSGHLYMNKVQIERDVYHISNAGLDIYPCQYKYFKVTKDSIIMESFTVPLTKLVNKASDALAASSLASKVNRRKPDAVIQLCEGAPEDQNAILSLGSTKSVKELSKKQLKEDAVRRDEELDKAQEAARNKGKSKGKPTDKEDSKPQKENKTNSGKGKEAKSQVDETSSKSQSNDKGSDKNDKSSKAADSKDSSIPATVDGGAPNPETAAPEKPPAKNTEKSKSKKH